jgi:hypothetical protein
MIFLYELQKVGRTSSTLPRRLSMGGGPQIPLHPSTRRTSERPLAVPRHEQLPQLTGLVRTDQYTKSEGRTRNSGKKEGV